MSNVSLVDGHIDEPKMTDEEIKKALECCKVARLNQDCLDLKCPFSTEYGCNIDAEDLRNEALDLIKRKDAEIERLKDFIEKDQGLILKLTGVPVNEYNQKIKSYAIKEFAEKLKCRSHRFKTIDRILVDCIPLDYIDNLVKEMVGD